MENVDSLVETTLSNPHMPSVALADTRLLTSVYCLTKAKLCVLE